MSHRMAPLSATFSDLEDHFRCLKPFHLTNSWKYIVYYQRSIQNTHESKSARGL